MKICLLCISCIALLTACNKPNKKIKEQITNADSIAINYFKGDGTMDTVVAVKIVRDKKIMEELTTLISAAQATPNIKCGYDGSLHFFKKNMVIQDIDFRMNDAECMYFTFKQSGGQTATKLSPQAKELLKAIKSK